MNELHIRALLAGVFFAIWPILLNRSGLTGNVSTAIFALGVFLTVLPFGIYKFPSGITADTSWTLVVSTCLLGGLGVLSFNGMLVKATPQQVGSLVVLTLVTQVAILQLNYVIYNGLTVSKTIGFSAAMLSAFLLTRE